MIGIDMNQNIQYRYASLRFFKEGERHITRTSLYNALLLVYDGVLRFTEDGTDYEVYPGQYFIQRKGAVHQGRLVSDSPKYLYVHFFGTWTEGEDSLPRSGSFDYTKLKTTMEALDTLSHTKAPHVLQASRFYHLLSLLYQHRTTDSANPTTRKIADFISKECQHPLSLDMLCNKFHFSKNHIINLFKRSYHTTPLAYANQVRLERAEYLLEVTSEPIENIAAQCGFQNYSNFYKRFYRKNGISPEKWRETKAYGAK